MLIKTYIKIIEIYLQVLLLSFTSGRIINNLHLKQPSLEEFSQRNAIDLSQIKFDIFHVTQNYKLHKRRQERRTFCFSRSLDFIYHYSKR